MTSSVLKTSVSLLFTQYEDNNSIQSSHNTNTNGGGEGATEGVDSRHWMRRWRTSRVLSWGDCAAESVRPQREKREARNQISSNEMKRDRCGEKSGSSRTPNAVNQSACRRQTVSAAADCWRNNNPWKKPTHVPPLRRRAATETCCRLTSSMCTCSL